MKYFIPYNHRYFVTILSRSNFRWRTTMERNEEGGVSGSERGHHVGDHDPKAPPHNRGNRMGHQLVGCVSVPIWLGRKWYIWKFLLHLLVYPILSLLTLPRTYVYTVSTYMLSRKCGLVQTLNRGYSFGVVCQEVELLHIGERSELLPSKGHGTEPKRIPSLGVEGRVRLVLLHAI